MCRQVPGDFFRRIDDHDDEVFYSAPRLVVHIDDDRFAIVRGIIEPTIGPPSFFRK